MNTRLQYCPVCERETPHIYQAMSFPVALLLTFLGVLPGLFYVWYAERRAQRTSTCTVNHEVLQEARVKDRVRELARALERANVARAAANRETSVSN